MVHIALTMLEKALGDRAAQESVTGRPDTYHVNAEDVDALLRALYETRNQVRAARDRYLRGPTDALASGLIHSDDSQSERSSSGSSR